MTSEGKIHSVIKNIHEIMEITPEGEDIVLCVAHIEPSVSLYDCQLILSKIEKEFDIIQILKKSYLLDEGEYFLIKIVNKNKFDEYYKKCIKNHFGSLEFLVGNNFLAVADVTFDIFNEHQISGDEEVEINLHPTIIRFSSLLPAVSVSLSEAYCQHRMKGLEYLKKNGAIDGYEQIGDYSIWDSTVRVRLDSIKFSKFYFRFTEVYSRRVKDSPNESNKKQEIEKNDDIINVQKHEHNHIHKFENNIQEKAITLENIPIPEEVAINKGKNKKYPPKFKETSWEKVTIRFLNKEDVIISVGGENKHSNYEGLGFKDHKSNKPNLAWKFLFGLSENNGATKTLPKPIPETTRQHKKTISDNLKQIFKNKTDPFEVTKSNEYKILINLIPPHTEDEDPRGVKEYLTETMVTEYESDYKE